MLIAAADVNLILIPGAVSWVCSSFNWLVSTLQSAMRYVSGSVDLKTLV